MPALDLPNEFIVFDMEWTAWEGSQDRGWDGPDEYREIYDIGAVLVTGDDFTMQETYHQLVKLEIVPTLPAFSTKLTGITQTQIDADGIPFSEMVPAFKRFAGDRPIYCWGIDGERLAENCELKKVPNPFPATQFRNMRDVFSAQGVPADEYMSSTIVQYFGEVNTHTAHQGLDDAQNIVEALRLLQERSTENGSPTG